MGHNPFVTALGRLRITGLDDVDGHIQDTTKAAVWLANASYIYRTKSDITHCHPSGRPNDYLKIITSLLPTLHTAFLVTAQFLLLTQTQEHKFVFSRTLGARAPTRLLVRGATASACRVSRAKKSPSPTSMLPIPHNILLQESQKGCPTSAAWLRMAPIGSWTVKASDPPHSRGRTADVQVILLSSSCLGIP